MIPPELEALLRPLETFEAIRRGAALLGDRLCDLSYANPYEGAAEGTRAVLRAVLDRERTLDFQYTPFGGQTQIRRQVADSLRTSHGLPWSFRDVVLTPGAMAALHLALRVAGGPGDEVVIPVPAWLDYPLYASYLGLKPVLVRLQEGDFGLDVEAICRAITPRTCAVLCSHPSNPAGRNYRAESLAALAEALALVQERFGRPLTFIADETHRDFVGAGGYSSAARVWPATLIVYSFGKYHFLQGQRTGYLAVSPRHPHRARAADEAVRWSRIMGFCTPTALMQWAIPGLLALRHELTWLEGLRAQTLAALAGAGYQVVPADATLFLYVRTPEGRDDFEFVQELAAAGVLALPAPVFHHRGYFRLSLTGSPRMLERGLAILREFAARPLCSGS